MIDDNITETIGRTPIVRIQRLPPANVTMYVKVEDVQSGWLGQRRLALGIIRTPTSRQAEARADRRRGDLGQHRHRARDGVRGPRLSVRRMMPESFSVERRQIMRAFGAKVILTPAAERGTGMVK